LLDGLLHSLTDIRGGKGHETLALRAVELAGGTEHTDVSLAHEVFDGQAATLVLAGKGDYVCEIGRGKPVYRTAVAALNAVGKLALLVVGEELGTPYLVEVGVERFLVVVHNCIIPNRILSEARPLPQGC